ncbi:hypothetical protein Tco_0268736 [Tanacetum coccineum]
MHREQAQQAVRDEKLVPTEDRVKIGKSNLRMDTTLTQKEETYQVILDIIKNTPCYNAFLVSANGQLKHISEMFVDHMHQPWRTLGAIINRCLSEKTSSNDRLRPSRIEILCGIYNKANVDYVALIWEDLQYQIDNRQSKGRRRRIMPYPRFTKAIIQHFISQHKSISKRQGSPYHTVDNNGVLDRLKFISKGEIHQVYGKSIPDTLITDDIQNSEAYKTFIGLSTGLDPPKIGRGKGAQGFKATVGPKKATAFSKKKRAKKIESSDEESEEEEERLIRRKPRGVIIQDTLQVPKKKSTDQSQKLKGASFRTEVPDEPTYQSADSDEGAGTSPEVLDESEDKSEAQDDLEDWGSTNDDTLLFDDKDEKIEDIPWVSIDDDETEDDDEEDDASIDIEKTDDERTDIDVEDQVKGVAEMNIAEEAEEENTKNVEEPKANEELKANEEQQGDDQAGDEQVEFINSLNASLIGTIPENDEAEINYLLDIQIQQDIPNIQQEPFHAVKVSVIPEPTQIPPSTPLASPLPTIVPLVVLVPISEILNDVSEVPEVVNKYLGSTLGDTLQKVLQRHTEELRREFSQKTIGQTHTKDLNLQVSQDDVSKFIKVKQERVAQEKMPKYSTTPYDQADDDEHKQKEILFKMMMASKSHEKHPAHKDLRHDDKDQDPSAGSGQGMKKRRTGKDAEPSKKSLKSKESAKGKTPSTTSKSGKSVSADKLVHKTKHIVQMDVEEPNLYNVANNADEPQEDAILKILKKYWFKKSPRPETLDPDWNTVKTIDDALEQLWFNEMIQSEKPPLTFDELMSTPIDFSAFSINRLKLNKVKIADLVGPVFNLLKGTYKRCVELEYNMKECYRALTDQLDWANPEGHKSPVDMRKPLPLHDKEGRLTIPVEFFFNNDLEYLKAGNKERSYSSSITKTPAARYTLEGIEDMILTLWSPFIIAYDKDAAFGISH